MIRFGLWLVGLVGSAVLMIGGLPAQAQTTVQVTVYAKKLWADSGLLVQAGDVITISAAGSWTWDYHDNPLVGPDGDPNDDYNAFDLFEPFDFFSQARLLGFIGPLPEQKHNNDPSFFPQESGYFSIGSGQTFIAPYSGKLWLGFNDGAVIEGTRDNKGSVLATVTVGGADATGPIITINGPKQACRQNQIVHASYSCTDPDDAVATCAGPVANGANVDTSVVGPHAFTVVATDSNGNTSSQTVGYTVADVAQAVLMPVGGTFAPAYVGTKSPAQAFYLFNPQTTDVNITSIATEGDYVLRSNACGSVLTAGTHCMVQVYFKPTVTGTERGAIDVTSDGNVASPPLWGIGTLVRALPNALSFPDQVIGTTSAPMVTTVHNDQATVLKISDVFATGDFAVDPSSTCQTGRMVKPGKSCSVAVTFTPTASGARAGTLTVHATVAMDPVSLNLTGNGTCGGAARGC